MGLGSSLKRAVKKITGGSGGLSDIFKSVNPWYLTTKAVQEIGQQAAGVILPQQDDPTEQFTVPQTEAQLQQATDASYENDQQTSRRRRSRSTAGYATSQGVLGDANIAIANRLLG